MHSSMTLRNSPHLPSTNVLATQKIILRFLLRLQAETRYQLISRPLHRFATARQIKSVASCQGLEKQLSIPHSLRRRLFVWTFQSVSFVSTLGKVLSLKVSVIMTTRHKWLHQSQAQSVKFDRNIWVKHNLRRAEKKDSSQTLNNHQRPKLQVYWRRTMKTQTITPT